MTLYLILVLVLVLVASLALWYGRIGTFETVQIPSPDVVSVFSDKQHGPPLTDITTCSWENEPPCRLP